MRRVAIGVDVGTTGARAVAVDEHGAVVATAGSSYPLHTPRPGWAEQDPADWWTGARDVLAATVRACDGDCVGLGLTGQMHGSVFVDRAGEVIRPALLWNDQRTASQCDDITRRLGAARLVEITGNPALTGFQAPKILWLRDEEPDHFARVAHVLLPKDHVRFHLTRELVTDASDAAGTLLMDLGARTWSTEMLDALELPAGWFPPVIEGPEVSGRVDADLAAELGLPAGVPVAAGGGDNAAAAVGTAVTVPGVVSSSIGTSGVLFAHAEDRAVDLSGRIHAFAHAVPKKYCLLAVTLSAGGSLRWWRDVTGLDYDELVAEAATAPVGSEGLVFLPYLTGERTPHLDPNARGAFIGLEARHTRRHLTRALMEGVLFSLRDGLDIMRSLGADPTEIRAIGGGAASPMWLQLQADVYGVPVRRLEIEEGAAYGAALLGHIAAGTFADVDEATAVVRTRDEMTEPDERTTAAYGELYDIYHGLYGTLRGDMHRLSSVPATASADSR